MPEITYRVTDVRPIPSTDLERRGKEEMLVSWIEDGVRPYQLTLHMEDYSSEKALALVRDQVAAHARIIGVEGKVGG